MGANPRLAKRRDGRAGQPFYQRTAQRVPLDLEPRRIRADSTLVPGQISSIREWRLIRVGIPGQGQARPLPYYEVNRVGSYRVGAGTPTLRSILDELAEQLEGDTQCKTYSAVDAQFDHGVDKILLC